MYVKYFTPQINHQNYVIKITKKLHMKSLYLKKTPSYFKTKKNELH
ncbi:hypothetical protein BN1221_00128 [Brenneria goodwinii]|uniref:Uncharacterized protein n=1 Tax=Brenneria goodwinii TaxID=1109412 RepID=A0A0G4JP91_9GAMM|nr:hypothetical protein BN1221_00128 [Brenneria goodwinii]